MPTNIDETGLAPKRPDMLTASDFKDAAEFEATVSTKLTRLDAEDLPCANSMVMFCPRPPFRGRNCGPWCLLRMARLEAEEEMESMLTASEVAV